MRDLILFCGMLFYTPMSLIAPGAGMMAWEWFSIMNPHQLVYGFAQGLRFNFVIAATTLLGWLVSRERKRFPPDLLPWIMLLFCAWFTFNLIFAPVPEVAWKYWYEFIRLYIGMFLAFMILNNKARIHAMVWTLVISVGYYGVRGGMYTLATAGGGHVLGPPGTMMSDNNSLALVEVLTLPLMYYLARHTENRLLRIGLQVAMGLQAISVFGSYSRGGFVALSVVVFFFWLRVRNKLMYLILGIVVVGVALSVMPAHYWTRIDTLHHVGTDDSFEERVSAWRVAFWYAQEHFPFGAGFYSLQVPRIWHHYYPGPGIAYAAHSIWFQVLGEQGFGGLAIYLTMLALGVRNVRQIIRRTRNQPELAWAHDLSSMMWAGLMGYFVGGSALSMAYFDGFMMFLVMSSTLREVVTTATAAEFVHADGRAPARHAARAAAMRPRGAYSRTAQGLQGGPAARL